jgi:hypothetical protein
MTIGPPRSAPRPILSYDLSSDGRVFGSITCAPEAEGALLADCLGQLLVLRKRGYFRQTLVLETVAEEEIARFSLGPLRRRGNLQTIDGKKLVFRISGRVDWHTAHGEFSGRVSTLPGQATGDGEIRQNHPDRPISPYPLSLWALMQLGRSLPSGSGDGLIPFSSVSSRLRDISSSSSWLTTEALIP